MLGISPSAVYSGNRARFPLSSCILLLLRLVLLPRVLQLHLLLRLLWLPLLLVLLLPLLLLFLPLLLPLPRCVRQRQVWRHPQHQQAWREPALHLARTVPCAVKRNECNARAPLL